MEKLKAVIANRIQSAKELTLKAISFNAPT
ncbi:hypothetical protein N483_07635 [Pseudoalteromonas luteoviolacea NCIMB 1944]|nr:hypothetical protein N483_07635 [Pseudoalteromonas luteoviolacea NCIMB 1944]